MQTRTELLTYLAGLTRCQRYLEVGVHDGANFLAVPSPHKVGVDPAADSRVPGVRKIASDEYFERFAAADGPFDLVFVDGDHRGPQVARDVAGALDCLSSRGAIVLHDSNPQSASESAPEPHPLAWCGTVWQAIAQLRCLPRPPLVRTVDMDYGCCVVLPRGVDGQQELSDLRYVPDPPVEDFFTLPYEWLAARRREVLNLVTPEELFRALAPRGLDAGQGA